MTIPSAPPPAAVSPGNLYVDAGPRILWLGVDTGVDPDGVVLVSDIVGTLAAIADAQAAAEAYADAGLATKAELVHTHVHTDITDFDASVVALISASPSTAIPLGGIIMWSGAIVDIGTGPLANWHLCDGGGGTPDLRDKMVLGAGNVATGTVNPNSTAVTTAAGAHTPVINNTTLTLAQVPAHTHTFSDVGTASGTTSSNGAHTHTVDGFLVSGGSSPGLVRTSAGTVPLSAAVSSSDGAHTHTFSASVAISGVTSSQGTGGSHGHTANPVADHTHSITSANLRAAIPWYALAYIQKVS